MKSSFCFFFINKKYIPNNHLSNDVKENIISANVKHSSRSSKLELIN